MLWRYIYVDTENLPLESWVPYLKGLRSTDTLYLFYTTNSQKFSYSDLPHILECKARIEIMKVQNGERNALDFVLISHLARKTYTASKSLHVILTKDKGYNTAVNYLTERGARVERIGSLHSIRGHL